MMPLPISKYISSMSAPTTASRTSTSPTNSSPTTTSTSPSTYWIDPDTVKFEYGDWAKFRCQSGLDPKTQKKLDEWDGLYNADDRWEPFHHKEAAYVWAKVTSPSPNATSTTSNPSRQRGTETEVEVSTEPKSKVLMFTCIRAPVSEIGHRLVPSVRNGFIPIGSTGISEFRQEDKAWLPSVRPSSALTSGPRHPSELPFTQMLTQGFRKITEGKSPLENSLVHAYCSALDQSSPGVLQHFKSIIPEKKTLQQYRYWVDAHIAAERKRKGPETSEAQGATESTTVRPSNATATQLATELGSEAETARKSTEVTLSNATMFELGTELGRRSVRPLLTLWNGAVDPTGEVGEPSETYAPSESTAVTLSNATMLQLGTELGSRCVRPIVALGNRDP